MKNLKFKKIGYFCDELSARYEAKITENLKVRVYKCAYQKCFTFKFCASNDFGLDELTGDLKSTIFKQDATKSWIIEEIKEIISDQEMFSKLESEAIKLMHKFNK